MHMHTVRHITAALITAILLTACGKETPPPAPKAEAPKPPEVLTVKIGSASPLTGPQ